MEHKLSERLPSTALWSTGVEAGLDECDTEVAKKTASLPSSMTLMDPSEAKRLLPGRELLGKTSPCDDAMQNIIFLDSAEVVEPLLSLGTCLQSCFQGATCGGGWCSMH